MPAKIEIPNLDNLIKRYQAGESALKLSREFVIERNVLRRRLMAAGITLRTNSEACSIRMSRMSIENRHAITANAHIAAKGRHASIEELEARAIVRQNSCSTQSPTERKFINLIRKKGIIVTPQKACGKYNIDIAIESDSVAVEIYGGSWHANGRAAFRDKQRIPYLLDAGWHLVIVWVDNARYPLTIKAINYIIALMKRIRLNEPLWREYHMIRGDGQLVTTPSFQFKGDTFIPSPAPNF